MRAWLKGYRTFWSVRNFFHPIQKAQELLEPFELVGERGFEPPASASRKQRSTRLSYSPTLYIGEFIAGSFAFV